MRAAGRQRGFLLIAAVVIIVAAGVMALVIVTLVAGSSRAGTQHLQSAQALFLARTGLEHASRLLLSPVLADRLPCAALTGDPRLTSAGLGTGTYTVTGAAPFYSSPAPTLAAALSATDTTVTLSSTAGLAPAGRILIDRETMHYAEISTCAGNPCLIGVQRNRDGTVAAAHASGTPVGQYQCNLASVGAVPNGTATERGQRTLGWGTQLQEGWILGDGGSILRFNAAASQPAIHNQWETAASPVGAQLNSVSMLSYADGWAVGDSQGGEVILHWNGVAWTQAATNGIPNTDLNSIHCVAANDCWVVGDAQGGAVILRWDGVSWSRANSGGLPDSDLNGVYCTRTGDCWIVGDSDNPPGPGGEREVILQWQGAGAGWTALAEDPALPDVNLNDIHCQATTDECWAVGDFEELFGFFQLDVILYRNGTGAGWTRVGPTLFAPNLNSVHCAASDACWAVGDALFGDEFILQWNGTAWSRSPPVAGVPDVNLHSVHCADNDDCWAVGDNSGGAVIIHWDGAAWSRVSPAGLADEDLQSVYVIGGHGRADAAWREIFP